MSRTSPAAVIMPESKCVARSSVTAEGKNLLRRLGTNGTCRLHTMITKIEPPRNAEALPVSHSLRSPRRRRRRLGWLLGVGAGTVGAGMVCAQSLTIPNGSFEGPDTSFVSVAIDAWQKPAKPAYFDEATFGFLWVQTAGLFANTAPGSPDHIDNMDGDQSAFILGFPQAAVFQELPGAGGTFSAGVSYNLQVDLFGKGLTDGSILTLSLFYRDAGNNPVTVASSPINYTAAAFPSTTHFSEFQLNSPVVQPGDAWAGQEIGIMLESTFGNGSGYWDVDHVRLTAVPEPVSVGLTALGLGGLALLRLRARARQQA